MNAGCAMQKHRAITRQAPSGAPGESHGVPTPGPQTQALVLSSAAVLQGQRSVTITHQGEAYRLQVTKLGKLILTK